jgi:hypothetical protein
MADFFVNHTDFPRGKTVKLQLLHQQLRWKVGMALSALWFP